MRLKWKARRECLFCPVEWTSGDYSVVVTGETASAKPTHWGAKLNGEWLCGNRGLPLCFNSCAAAKRYCWRHSAGFFEGKTSGLLKKNLSKS